MAADPIDREALPEGSDPAIGGQPSITVRALILGAVTIAGIFYWIDIAVKSQLPLVVLGAFVLWIFGNILLKRWLPSLALKRGELLIIFGMLWAQGWICRQAWRRGAAVLPRDARRGGRGFLHPA